MKKNTPTTTPKKPGRSENIPAEVPEPDQDALGITGNGYANTTYSGMRGNMALFLADRQDRVASYAAPVLSFIRPHHQRALGLFPVWYLEVFPD